MSRLSLGPAQFPVDPGVKQAGPEADSSPPFCDGLNSAWNYTSTLPHAFMMWARITVLNLMNLGCAACVRACVYNSEAGRCVKYEVTVHCYCRTCMDIIGRADIFIFMYVFLCCVGVSVIVF